jgi:hypothetical protein
MVLRLNEVVYAPFYALFIVGPVAVLIDLRVRSKPSPVFRAEPAS